MYENIRVPPPPPPGIDLWHRVFCLVFFDGINLSTASTKPDLNLIYMSLTDKWLWSVDELSRFRSIILNIR